MDQYNAADRISHKGSAAFQVLIKFEPSRPLGETPGGRFERLDCTCETTIGIRLLLLSPGESTPSEQFRTSLFVETP